MLELNLERGSWSLRMKGTEGQIAHAVFAAFAILNDTIALGIERGRFVLWVAVTEPLSHSSVW
jgi:hypothetical protein